MASNDSAQYAINIAAQMSGAVKTNDELNALTDSLVAGGKDASYFKDAIAQVARELDSAKLAVTAANDALAEGKSRYRELETAADQSAKAAERAALKHGGVVPRELFDEAERAKKALDAEALSLKKLEDAAAAATGKQDKLKTTAGNLNELNKHVNARLSEQASKTSKLAGALGDLGGPLGSVGQMLIRPVKGFFDLSEAFGKSRATALLMAAGALILVAVVVALSVAALAGVVAITKWGVTLADQARSAQLAADAFAATSDEAAASVGAWSDVTRSTGVTTDRLRDLTKQLKAAKVSAADMPKALMAAAKAESALGQGGADSFIDDLKTAKTSVDVFASDVERKFGGIVTRKMLGLEAQGARLQSNLAKTFGGLHIDPLLEGLSLLVNLFDENTASGRALKFLFEHVFQPIIDQVAKATPLIEGLFLGFEIGLVKLYIKLQPTIKAISEFLGFNDDTSAKTFEKMWKAGEYVAYAFAAVVAVLGVAAALIGGALVAAVGAAVVAINVVILAVQGWIAIFEALGGAVSVGFRAIVDTFSAIGDIGMNVMRGLAEGISAGAGLVVSAITGAVHGAIDAAKSLLGIHSPSKLFADIGGFTAEGFAIGVDDGAPDAQKAIAAMVEPPPELAQSAVSTLTSPVDKLANTSAASGAATANSTESKASVSLSGVEINLYGVKDAADAEIKFRDLLLQMMNGTLTQTGGANGAVA